MSQWSCSLFLTTCVFRLRFTFLAVLIRYDSRKFESFSVNYGGLVQKLRDVLLTTPSILDENLRIDIFPSSHNFRLNDFEIHNHASQGENLPFQIEYHTLTIRISLMMFLSSIAYRKEESQTLPLIRHLPSQLKPRPQLNPRRVEERRSKCAS